MDSIVSQEQAHKLHAEGFEICRREGKPAVFKYAIKLGLTEHRYCASCETDCPVIGYKDFEDKIQLFCFICGQAKFLGV